MDEVEVVNAVEPADGSPTIEVVAYRSGAEIHRELCETEDDAQTVVAHWSEEEGVECTVDDLSVHHTPDDILEPTLDQLPDEDEYRTDDWAAEDQDNAID